MLLNIGCQGSEAPVRYKFFVTKITIALYNIFEHDKFRYKFCC